MNTSTDTPISAYGIFAVSRPTAARLLGLKRKAFNRKIATGQIAVAGRTHLRIDVAEIEALTGRKITAHDYLTAVGAGR